jgi:23S rRNA (guanosine2251-2'-O)-methyltransferase
VEHFKKRGYKVVCAGIRDSVSSFEADMKNPIYLIVGGEKRGISASILAMADEVVRIDYGREFPLSLSAASAASMLAYEVLRANTKK